MNFKKIILVILVGFVFWATTKAVGAIPPPPHDIHLSKCAITYSEDKKTLNLQWHIWLDDLAVGLEKSGIGDLQLYTGNKVASADEKLMQYLRTKMNLSVNEKPVQFNWVKKESSEDLLAVWVHLEVKNIQQLNSIKVQNCILMDVYSDQQNIIHIKGPKGRQGYLIFEDEKQEEEIFF